jgi:hypothetical protein
LTDSYETAQIFISRDFEEFGKAIKSLYTLLKEQMRDIASVVEEFFSDHIKRIMEGRFRQKLFEELFKEILVMILEYIGLCRYLIVFSESRRLME